MGNQELREKIAKLNNKCDMIDCQHRPGSWECNLCLADQIITLLPDVEEIRKQERERMLVWGIEQCQEHYKGGGVISRRECPKCWLSLKSI